MLSKFQITSGPSSEPVSLEELQTHLHFSTDDSYLNSLIKAARIAAEHYTGRAFITRTVKAFADGWESKLVLPFPKVTAITSVSYYNDDGVLTLLSEDYYWKELNSEPTAVIRKYDVTYPELQDGRPSAIEIVYTAGYGTASAVPDDIKHAIKLIATDYFEHRGQVVIGGVNRIPQHLTYLLHPYKIYNF